MFGAHLATAKASAPAGVTVVALTPPAGQSLSGTLARTFASCDLGTPASNRSIVVFVSGYYYGSTVNSVTVNGVSATLLATTSNSNTAWIASVPSGSTGDIVATIGGGGWDRGVVVCYALYGANTTPTQTLYKDRDGSGFFGFTSVVTPTNGVSVATVSLTTTPPPDVTWAIWTAAGTYDEGNGINSICRVSTNVAGTTSPRSTDQAYNDASGICLSFGP